MNVKTYLVLKLERTDPVPQDEDPHHLSGAALTTLREQLSRAGWAAEIRSFSTKTARTKAS